MALESNVDDAIRPWSSRIEASWRTTLRFYERRYEILREIEDRIGISAYSNEEDAVGARLPGDACEIELRPAGLTLRARNPTADIEQLMAAGTIMLKAMEYPRLTHGHVRLQHVVSLNAPFGEAVQQGLSNVFSGWVNRVGMNDFSLVYDGVWEDRSYQIEFGIASGDELDMRLHGWASRLNIEAPRAGEADPIDNPPAAALYVDSHWSHAPDEDEIATFDLDTYYTEVVSVANEVVEALMGTVEGKAEMS